jgi:hypothetical protein
MIQFCLCLACYLIILGVVVPLDVLVLKTGSSDHGCVSKMEEVMAILSLVWIGPLALIVACISSLFKEEESH